MQTFREGYRGLSLLIDINRDLLLSAFALAFALGLGAWFLSAITSVPAAGVI